MTKTIKVILRKCCRRKKSLREKIEIRKKERSQEERTKGTQKVFANGALKFCAETKLNSLIRTKKTKIMKKILVKTLMILMKMANRGMIVIPIMETVEETPKMNMATRIKSLMKMMEFKMIIGHVKICIYAQNPNAMTTIANLLISALRVLNASHRIKNL